MLDAAAADTKAQQVTLQVVIAEGAKPMRESVTFNIARVAPGGRLEPVDTKIGAPLKIALPQGRYQVEASYGDTSVTSTFDVAGKALTHRISLNAGWAHLRVIPHRGALPLTSAIDWEVLTYGRDATGQRHRVAAVKSPNPRVVLPAGHYVVQAKTRDSLAKHTIEITAGHTYKYTLDLNAGAVAFSAVRGGGGPTIEETVDWQVFKASDASLSKPVTTRSAASGRFWLREGRYIVLARQGQWNGRANFEVRSGNERSISVELK
ncbi:hypothetical protein HBA54_10130 [Pelagibius litoralis]|uniref:Uncharacterized protein n=1 Tax=Pelagibius litoralis TaxID=374515 RepID=A0A967C4Z0_9PROT|nr:hypothetical protein [Pelagibius litoralis]NIA68950.1 hypothetical protein [Pelagibius litoralis]